MAKKLWKMENGEILYEGLRRESRKKYKADTPFDCGIAPYLIMVFCAAVDGAVFYSLFSAISYDRPLMLGVQIAGFLFGFDVVPIYIGIQLRRLRQEISRDWFILWMALGVCAVVCAMNVALRLSTMEQMTAGAVVQTSILGVQVQETAKELDPTAAALTVFGIGIPMVTSVGSFFISYLTYDPLQIRKRRLEEMIAQKRDEIRRFEAVLSDYDAEADFARSLLEADEGKYEQIQRLHRAVVLGYCDYVRQRLKEALADPTSNNILSKEVCAQIMARMDRELASLDGAEEIINTEIVPMAANVRRIRG